jgi:hypothetical protein
MKTKTLVEVTRSAVFAAIGKTWFDLSEEDGRFDLETRMHGDVGDAVAGDEDKKEGLRILRALRKSFPVTDFETDFDVVDEWVSVSVRIAPLNEKERAKMAKDANVADWNEALGAVKEAFNSAIVAEGGNMRGPMGFYVATGSSYSPDRIEVKVEFGERFLYHGHLGAGIKFKTAAEAEAAGKEALAVFPVAWTVSHTKPFDRTTYNKPAPHNIIETTGSVVFTAPLVAAPVAFRAKN